MKSKLLYASYDLVVEMKENLYIKIAFTEVEIAYRLDLSSYQNVIKIKLPLPFYCETFANLDCFLWTAHDFLNTHLELELLTYVILWTSV